MPDDQAETPPPIFMLCSCGKHGRVVAGDGFWGPEFATIPMAREVIESGLAEEKYSEGHARRMLKEAKEAGLPARFEQVDLSLSWVIETFRRKFENEHPFNDPTLVHEFLTAQLQGPLKTMPHDFAQVVRHSFVVDQAIQTGWLAPRLGKRS
jgi:hypothetical protein